MNRKMYLVDTSRRGRRTHLIKVQEEKVTRDWGKVIGAFLAFSSLTGTSAVGAGIMAREAAEHQALLPLAVAGMLMALGMISLALGASEVSWHLRDKVSHTFSTYESFLGLAWRPEGLKGTGPARWWQKKNGHINATLNDQLAERFTQHDETDTMEWKLW